MQKKTKKMQSENATTKYKCKENANKNAPKKTNRQKTEKNAKKIHKMQKFKKCAQNNGKKGANK